MKKMALALSAVLVLGAAAARAQETPAAVIVKVTGDVQVKPAEGEANAARVGTKLFVGDQIIPAAGAQAVVVGRSGSTTAVTEPVTIQKATEDKEGGMFARTVQVLARAANTDARSQPNRQGMIRPIPGQPTQVAPRNSITVLAVRPTFRWHKVENAKGYVVQIRKQGSPPERFQSGPDTSWTLPDTAGALMRGETYYWTIAPAGTGRPAREQAFQVATEDTYQAVDGNLESLRDAGMDPASDGLFLAAVVYREAGLFYDAADALEALKDSGEPMGADAYFLLGEVLDTLGRLDEAQAAFDQGDRLAGS